MSEQEIEARLDAENKDNEVSGNEPVCFHDGNLFNHHQQFSADHQFPVQQDILLSDNPFLALRSHRYHPQLMPGKHQ